MIAGENYKSSKAPRFTPEIIYFQWEQDFKAFCRRIPECHLILSNPAKPTPPIQLPDESKLEFKKRLKKWESDLESWGRGNGALYSYLYEAVAGHTRAHNVVCDNNPDGTRAFAALSAEFENSNILREQAVDLKAEFENRKIAKVETITQWISILENYRLRLRNLGIEIKDEGMANKIKTSMVSDDNKHYMNALTAIVMVCPDINYADLSSRLRRFDEILVKNNPDLVASNIINNAAIMSSQSAPAPAAHFNHVPKQNGNQNFRKNGL